MVDNQLRYGRITGSLKKLKLSTTNPVYIGKVLYKDYPERCYIKFIDHNAIVNEYLCAELALFYQLQTAIPVIAIHENTIVFCSVDVNYPSLHGLINGNTINNNAIIEQLIDWKQLQKAACFDELINNDDRNQQNLLIGGDGIFLIDHEAAFTKNKEAKCQPNMLLNVDLMGIQDTDEVGKQRKLKEYNNKLGELPLNTGEQWLQLFTSHAVIDKERATLLINYLTDRHRQLKTFIELHLNLKQISLLNHG